MKTIEFPLAESMLKTLHKRKCKVKWVGPDTYRIKTEERKIYEVKLSPTKNGFAYTCVRVKTGQECKSMGYPVVCRHAVSASLLAIARNEGLRRAA